MFCDVGVRAYGFSVRVYSGSTYGKKELVPVKFHGLNIMLCDCFEWTGERGPFSSRLHKHIHFNTNTSHCVRFSNVINTGLPRFV